MHVAGTRCILRRLRPTDAAALARHGNNINVARHLRDRFPHPYTPGDAASFIEFAASLESDAAIVAIEVGGEVAGVTGLTVGADVERFAAEIGYWLGEQYWGQGIATEAVSLLTTYAFDHLNLLRLFALPFADNAASVRVLEKAGYVREGLLRSSAVKYGRPRDQFLYAAVSPRWVPPVAPGRNA